LRELLEGEVRAAFDQACADGDSIDSLLLVGRVLERHRHLEDVAREFEFLFDYLEAYVDLLEARKR
jgi:hypothetical protein